jgi:hypothetical protein
MRAQIGSWGLGQRSTEFSDGGATGSDDDDFIHFVLQIRFENRQLQMIKPCEA